MALSDLVFQDATPANVTFRLASTSASAASYSDASRSIVEPRTFSVSHQITGKGTSGRVRTRVRIDDTQVAADGVEIESAAVFIVIDRPTRVLENADLKHSIALLKNALTTANIDVLLAGQLL